MFHSFGTNNSKGISTLIVHNSIKVVDHQETEAGRAVLVNVEVDGATLYIFVNHTFVNIDDPNKVTDRHTFFDVLLQ